MRDVVPVMSIHPAEEVSAVSEGGEGRTFCDWCILETRHDWRGRRSKATEVIHSFTSHVQSITGSKSPSTEPLSYPGRTCKSGNIASNHDGFIPRHLFSSHQQLHQP